MSISVQIPNCFSYYDINESRVKRLLSGDKEYATYMGLWDKFKDYFRSEKKSVALERLHDFIHDDETVGHEENEDPVPRTMRAFEKLKSLAKDIYTESFRIEVNSYEGIDFYISSNVVKTLDNCISSYALYELNHHPEIKNVIGNRLNDALHNSEPIYLNQLVLDMIRQTGGAIDYIPLSNDTEENQDITAELTNVFYESLTHPQQKAVAEVGSQAVFAHIHTALIHEPNVFGHNFVSINVSPSTVMYHNEDSSDITVIQTLRREPAETYYQAVNVERLQDRFPTLQYDVAFTISSEGQVECSFLHASNTIRSPVMSLVDLKTMISG